jgi:hypothetical protein
MSSDQGVRPVRLIVADDLRRDRPTVLFRGLFAVPLMLWLAGWSIVALLAGAANWLATLLLGRPPASLHAFLTRYVRYATQAFAYLNLLSDPYPSFTGKPGYPIDLVIDPPARQSRLKVGLRLILAVPAMFLTSILAGFGANGYTFALSPQLSQTAFTVLTIAALLGWFSALARGRMPRGLRDMGAYGLSYGAQFWAYLLLLTDRYPSSDPLTALGPLPIRNHPVRLETGGEMRRSRLTVFFRLLLTIPHLVWLALWSVLALGAAVINWFATLILGTPPAALHRLLAAYLRYQAHVVAYLYLIGNPFPGFTGAEGRYPIDLHFAAPERQNRWTVLFRPVLAVPAFFVNSVYNTLLFLAGFLGWFAALVTGRMPVGLRNAGALAIGYAAQTNAYLFLVTGAYPNSGPEEWRLTPIVSAPPPMPAPAASPTPVAV